MAKGWEPPRRSKMPDIPVVVINKEEAEKVLDLLANIANSLEILASTVSTNRELVIKKAYVDALEEGR